MYLSWCLSYLKVELSIHFSLLLNKITGYQYLLESRLKTES